jgi:hypothetical protein
MALTDAIKTDLLLKKLYGVARSTGVKTPGQEGIASPSLIRGDQVWNQASSIPTTAAAVAGIVQAYTSTSKVECVADSNTTSISNGSVLINPMWKTNLTNWIPTEFDTANAVNTYRVAVYYGNSGLSDPATTGGTQIFADGSGGQGEWYFDYKAGTLHFLNVPPLVMTATQVIYVYGYRYIGTVGISTVAGTGSYTSLTNTPNIWARTFTMMGG